MFDQPCQRGHLPLNPETLTIGNKTVTISGDPSKQPNDNIKTKLKNISTTTTQEPLPVALLSSVACELAPLRIVLLCGVFYLFFIFLLLFLIRVSSAMIMYDRRTLLDIGQRYTNLIQNTLSADPAWPLEILRSTELNNDHLNNRRRRRKHRGRRVGIRNRLRKRAHNPPLPSILLANV